jgi:hypothetical protein
MQLISLLSTHSTRAFASAGTKADFWGFKIVLCVYILCQKFVQHKAA